MIAHLRGLISKGIPGEAAVDVAGVGYRVLLPLSTWDALEEGSQTLVWVSTYVREDRLELYAFGDKATRMLFERLIELPGIGPKLGLELCSVPRSLLAQSLREEDPRLLQSIKGVGKKTAEKLLLELKSLADKQPMMFVESIPTPGGLGARYDQDAIAALSQLGYTTPDILRALETLPKDMHTTEERVAAALRAL